LPDAVRGKMEAALGADFANVRVHVGPQPERVGAIAFTIGSDIYFAPGRYQPETIEGQQLLGHELAHVVQQRAGRVRNPLGSGLAVVQDHALEAEADRMGQRAAGRIVLRQAPPIVAKTADIQTQRMMIRGERIQAAVARSRPTAIQRTIWRYDNGKWVVDEPGTKGRFSRPKKGKQGEYFNSVNNKKAMNKEKVRAGLSDLLMISGSLTDKKIDLKWPEALWTDLFKLDSGVWPLGKVTVSFAKQPVYLPYGYVKNNENVLNKAWAFLDPFMRRNGQLPYIERQDWYKNGDAEVDVDINFYKDRKPEDAQLAFHKDTAGDNLFVNLIFNNDKKMLAAEWIEDLADPTRRKLAAMNRFMPAGMIEEINTSRLAMQQNQHKILGAGTIRGGIAGKVAFVSWVDDLLWHATPSPLNRSAVTGFMYYWLSNPWEYWKAKNEKTGAHRALHYLSTFPDTLIAETKQEQKQTGTQRFGTAIADAYFESVVPQASVTEDNYVEGPNYGRHMDDVARYQTQLENASISLAIGQELAPDPKGIGTLELNQRTGIRSVDRTNKPRTQRANSVSRLDRKDPQRGENKKRRNKITLQELEEAAANYPTRSFLRTWVRVRKVTT
jgi:hypothetical protein